MRAWGMRCHLILKALLAVAPRHTIVEESSEVLADNKLHSTSAVKACVVTPGAIEGEVAIVELTEELPRILVVVALVNPIELDNVVRKIASIALLLTENALSEVICVPLSKTIAIIFTAFDVGEGVLECGLIRRGNRSGDEIHLVYRSGHKGLGGGTELGRHLGLLGLLGLIGLQRMYNDAISLYYAKYNFNFFLRKIYLAYFIYY